MQHLFYLIHEHSYSIPQNKTNSHVPQALLEVVFFPDTRNNFHINTVQYLAIQLLSGLGGNMF